MTRVSAIASSGTFFLREYRTENRSDQTGLTGSTSLSYALNARTSLIGGVRVNYDSYQQSTRQRGSRTRYYQAFAGFEYLIAPDLRMSLQAGPAWIDQTTNPDRLDFRTYSFVGSFNGLLPQDFLDPSVDPGQPFGFLLDQSSCPTLGGVSYASVFSFANPSGCVIATDSGGNPVPVLQTTSNNPIRTGQPQLAGRSEDEDDGWDLFASFELVKTWEWGDVSLSYNRRQTDSGGGVGNSSIADSVSLIASGFEPAPMIY